MKLSVTVVVKMCVVIVVVILAGSVSAQVPGKITEEQFILRPIGKIHQEKGNATLVINKEIEPALRGLDGYSHIWVFWWFDRNDIPEERSILQVFPRGNRENPLTGVFACRSPFRPNLIGLTLCKILSVKGNIVEIDKIDAFNDTPILDLKPYIPQIDSAESSAPDWLMRGRKKLNN